MCKIAIDLRLFELLANGTPSMSTTELAMATDTDYTLLSEVFSTYAFILQFLHGLCDSRVLLERILRYLASFRMLEEQKEDRYAATHITRSLSIPGFRAGVEHHFDAQLPCWVALPEFLVQTNYRNPSDVLHTPFQAAHNTDLSAFAWAISQPRLMQDFNLWMTVQRENQKTWLDVFPLEELSRDPQLEAPLFVDIGGGLGQQCAALKRKIPTITRRIVLQDLPATIAHAVTVEGVEHMEHDFWNPQPVKATSNPADLEKGASYYYMRNVLHDFPDEKCVGLLQNTMAAMSADSAILIDEKILPETNTHWHAAQLDIAMMASLASIERSEKQWRALLDEAGLKLQAVYTYTQDLRDSVIVAVVK
ncbi:MAG: hypothetical protein Q9187_007459 [Circinaria calcarea]